jgi:hypothetical protein
LSVGLAADLGPGEADLLDYKNSEADLAARISRWPVIVLGAKNEVVPPAVEVEGWWSPSGRCRSGIVRSHLTYT